MRQQSPLWMWLADGKVGPPQFDEYETGSDADLLIKRARIFQVKLFMSQDQDDNQVRTLGYSIKKTELFIAYKNTETKKNGRPKVCSPCSLENSLGCWVYLIMNKTEFS